MKISVIIPAYNEELKIEKCLQTIEDARRKSGHEVEVIVSLNRCTDRTAILCEAFGVKTVVEDAKNLSKIRNAAAKRAAGDVIVTIDADSRMSPNMFVEIDKFLSTGKYIGGGVYIRPERYSLGIILSALVILPFALLQGVPSAGLFWCLRRDFEAIGGFDENQLTVEDVDFAKRLKAYGRRHGKKFGTIRKAFIVTSCRKFDRFGDWYFFRNPAVIRGLFRGNKELAKKFYYDFEREIE